VADNAQLKTLRAFPGIAPHDLRRYAESRTMPNRREGGSIGVEFVTNAVNLFGIVRKDSEAFQDAASY
jgi:hypothetical protein